MSYARVEHILADALEAERPEEEEREDGMTTKEAIAIISDNLYYAPADDMDIRERKEALSVLSGLAEENERLKAELDAARPLIDAAMKVDHCPIGPFGHKTVSDSARGLIAAALAYREGSK